MRISNSVAVLLCLLGLAVAGCKSKTEARAGGQVSAPTNPLQASAVTAAPFPKLPAPTLAEVESAMARIFGEVIVIQSSKRQGFIVGDFNGDGAEDLAVIARPAPGKMAEVNSALANWTIQDADKAFVPSPGRRVVRMEKIKPSRVGEGEAVLAIIHGYGPKGWRDPEARQAYLVKHAAATFQGAAPAMGEKTIRAMHLPVETEIIREVRDGREGFLFWTGGAYAWCAAEADSENR